MIQIFDSRRFGWIAVLMALLCGAGCTVGPNFKKPTAPDAAGYTPAPPEATSGTPKVDGGEAQTFTETRDIPGDWWTVFHSRPLNGLIERALKANPDLKSAQAALTVARENTLAQRGYYYPNISAGFSAARARTSAEVSPFTASGALSYSLYTPQVNVSFVPDVFGLNKRTIESLKAQQEQARYALAATHITLSSNIASAAIQEASLRGQIEATGALVTINTQMLEILRHQLARGYATELDVAAQQAALAQVNATLPPLLKQLAQQRDLLAMLAGGFPNQEMPEKFELAGFQLPRELPLTIPSKLVEQRPDILQAEENLHAASALIGVAHANRLPSFALTADTGSMALIFSHIFSRGGFWDTAAGLTQPVFDGGTLKHKELAAKAAYTQAEEQYKSTVLQAFQNVADTLHAIEQDADGLKAASAAADAAKVTLDLTKKQLDSGYTNYLALLSAEQAYQQAVLNVVQAQTNRYTDTAALFQALGGGWWHRPDLPKS
ncbi:MAG TPA: efflux transporter outer membrane subunit [Bryobacteraceae bacterium]|nr:efflux transporter outer membrane subunit [Bryobacteraceae bacterium]